MEYEDIFLTAKEAAKFLRVTEHTITNWAHNGLIPSKIIGSKILIPKKYIEEYKKNDE